MEENGNGHRGPSEEEKATFLALLRAGHDPPSAAQMVNPTYTGSTFKRVTNEKSSRYDPFFAADYLRARAEQRQKAPPRSSSSQPRTTTLSGHIKAAYITEEMLEGFLEDVANGVPITVACERIEPKTSLSQIHRRALRDEQFAENYARAKEAGYPIFQENLRAEAVRQAFNGAYPALRDQLMIHVPEFRNLITSRHEVVGGMTSEMRIVVERALPSLPTEIIDQMIKHIEENEQKLIEQ